MGKLFLEFFFSDYALQLDYLLCEPIPNAILSLNRLCG